jgi:hypothetical protein
MKKKTDIETARNRHNRHKKQTKGGKTGAKKYKLDTKTVRTYTKTNIRTAKTDRHMPKNSNIAYYIANLSKQ